MPWASGLDGGSGQETRHKWTVEARASPAASGAPSQPVWTLKESRPCSLPAISLLSQRSRELYCSRGRKDKRCLLLPVPWGPTYCGRKMSLKSLDKLVCVPTVYTGGAPVEPPGAGGCRQALARGPLCFTIYFLLKQMCFLMDTFVCLNIYFSREKHTK